MSSTFGAMGALILVLVVVGVTIPFIMNTTDTAEGQIIQSSSCSRGVFQGVCLSECSDSIHSNSPGYPAICGDGQRCCVAKDEVSAGSFFNVFQNALEDCARIPGKCDDASVLAAQIVKDSEATLSFSRDRVSYFIDGTGDSVDLSTRVVACLEEQTISGFDLVRGSEGPTSSYNRLEGLSFTGFEPFESGVCARFE